MNHFIGEFVATRGHFNYRAALFDSDPTQRTILVGAPAREYGLKNHVRVCLPFIRFVVGFYETETAQAGELYYQSNTMLHVFGSLKPFHRLDQNVFVMPFPNMMPDGQLKCWGTVSPGRVSRTVESLGDSIIQSFWDSEFSYWSYSPPTGCNFHVLRNGIKGLKTIEADFKLSQFIKRKGK